MQTKTQGDSVRFSFKGAGQRSEALLLIQACFFGGFGLLVLYAAFRTFSDYRYVLAVFCLLIGIGVPSWDVEIINRTLREKTGDNLSIAGLPEEIPEHLWNK